MVWACYVAAYPCACMCVRTHTAAGRGSAEGVRAERGSTQVRRPRGDSMLVKKAPAARGPWVSRGTGPDPTLGP